MTDDEWEVELWERMRRQPPWLALAILNKAYDNGDLSDEAYRRLIDRPLGCIDHDWSHTVTVTLDGQQVATRRCKTCHLPDVRIPEQAKDE